MTWLFQTDTVYDWASGDKIFSKEECETIISYGGTTFEKGSILLNGGEHLNPEIRDSEVSWVHPSEDTKWLFLRLSEVIEQINAKYFGFDLLGILEGIQLTKYEAPSGFYCGHIDKLFGRVVRKLSITVQLSDPTSYEGGELRLILSKDPQVMDKSLGKLIAFPSYVLHEVTPVTKGTRYSLVAWVAGNQFK
jgi:PKHD-type hydroxylase